MTKLFVTGSTGYIGGDALFAVANKYPELEITALVRNSDKGAKVSSQYPGIRLVYGNLDSIELLETEAYMADIVLHCADCDHVASAAALVAGLARKETKGYLIHTSGTGILSFKDLEMQTFGVNSEKVYNDWDGIKEVTSLPDLALHRNVDKIILAASSTHPNKIYTAIVCPPCIYGPGRGPDNQKSVQVYRMARVSLQRGKAFHVEEGENTWTQVHIRDLSNIFLLLVTSALSPEGGKATWNQDGYYFGESGDFLWGDVGRAIAQIASEKKLIKSAEIDTISRTESDKLLPMGSYLWGTNSRCRAIRANKLLGWTPSEKSLFELLPEIVEGEAKELGLIKSHIERAAGEPVNIQALT